MANIKQRFCVKSSCGCYFGDITTSFDKAKEILETAKKSDTAKDWHIVWWYD